MDVVALGEQAVRALYQGAADEERRQAESWLLHVRTTPQGWELAWAFLEPGMLRRATRIPPNKCSH